MAQESSSLTAYQLRVLAVLALINFVNFAERGVVPPLVPLLRGEFGASSAQLGLLQVVLQAVLAVASIPFGLFADRWSRTRVISFGVIFAGAATVLSGIATTFTMLLAARALVGVGEAAYAPAGQSMISGAFSLQSRARAQAIFAAGMLLGGAAGQLLGSVIGDAFGWRRAFIYIGIPGIAFVLAVVGVAEPPRGPRSEAIPLRLLLGVPAFVALIASGIMITFASVAFITWGTDFLVRYKDFSLREAGVSLGPTLLISLLLGVLAGGAIADLLQKRFLSGRILTVAAGFLFAAPFLLWAITTEEKLSVVIAFFTAAFFMSWYHGPVTAVIHDLMPSRAHASSVGVYMFATQLLGGILGPYVVGEIDDLSDLLIGLRVAIGVMIAGGLTMFLVMYFIRRDGLHHPRLEAFRAAASD